MTQRMSDEIITVRYYSGTNISRFRGKTASCTSGRRAAAEAVARKVMGATPFIIEMCGNEYAWKVVSTNAPVLGSGTPRTEQPVVGRKLTKGA